MKWYQKLRDDKKLKLILTAIALLLVSIGSTYAWWTASTSVEQKISMGNLKLEATFTDETFTNYEPGTYAEIAGTIKNTGTIPAFVKIANVSQITFAYSDDNLTPITSPQPESIDPNVVKMSSEPQSGDFEDTSGVSWFVDAAGDRYLLMEPSSILNITINVSFDGPLTTNKYMDAAVDVKANIQATQVIEGAIQSEFGVDASTLEALPQTQNRLARSAVTQSPAKAHLQALLQRGK